MHLSSPPSLLLLTLLFDKGLCAAHWSYFGPNGYHNWANVDTSPMPNECAGKFQSPIDISERCAEYDPSVGPIKFVNYHTPLKDPIIFNNGHSVQVQGTPDRNIYVQARGYSGNYQFVQFHFHWGQESSRGSEHTFDGEAFPMELHLVHFNQNYGTFPEALKRKDGLLVIGIIFEISRIPNKELQPIVDALSEVRTEDPNGFALTAPVILNNLLPRITSNFFSYNGSLTTPPCSESVIHNVLATRVPISEQQMQQFRLVRAGDANAPFLVDNFRPTLSLNGRRVLKSFPTSAGSYSGGRDCYTAVLVFLVAFGGGRFLLS